MRMNITLRQLEVFCAVARHSNVSRAAEDVHISQSATSMALAELERQLGTRLFDRFGKRLVMNANGKALFPLADDLLARAGEVEGLFGSGGPGAALRVGASSTIGIYLMPGMLRQFSDACPDGQVQLQVGNTEQVIRALKDCEIDIGFIEGLCSDPAVDSRPWRSDELIVVASPKHPLASKRRLVPRDLEEADWILREPGSGTRRVFELAIAGRLEALKVRFELGHTEAVKRAVASQLGVSCLSRLTVQDELRDKSLVQLTVPFLSLRRELYLLLLKNKYVTSSMGTFLETVGAPAGVSNQG